MAGEDLPQSMELGKSQKNMKEQARETSGRGCQTVRVACTGPWREGPDMLRNRGVVRMIGAGEGQGRPGRSHGRSWVEDHVALQWMGACDCHVSALYPATCPHIWDSILLSLCNVPSDLRGSLRVLWKLGSCRVCVCVMCVCESVCVCMYVSVVCVCMCTCVHVCVY